MKIVEELTENDAFDGGWMIDDDQQRIRSSSRSNAVPFVTQQSVRHTVPFVKQQSVRVLCILSAMWREEVLF